jgi:PadR family transcriptional regulator, regulatory protein PadR
MYNSATYHFVEVIMLSKDLVAASARPMILSILSHGESYGYEIIQQVRQLSNGKIEWSDGMLYPVLRRLENENLVESEWRTAETGRKRRYYRLNNQGGQALKKEKEQWFIVHNTLQTLWEASNV